MNPENTCMLVIIKDDIWGCKGHLGFLSMKGLEKYAKEFEI